jgi:hypothetical protein
MDPHSASRTLQKFGRYERRRSLRQIGKRVGKAGFMSRAYFGARRRFT